MQPLSEVVLATLPGADDSEQLVVVLCQTPEHGSRLELRQQTWGDGIGWFTQNRIQLQPHQVAELRAVLGSSGSQAKRPRRDSTPLPKAFSRLAPDAFVPRVVHADSA